MNILNKEKILEQAKIFIDMGKFDKAIREYEKILLADPSDLKVKIKIAELYTRRKQIADAIKSYKDVAESYTKEGFFLKAVTVYKNILRLNPSIIDVNEQLAGLYEKMGLTFDAIRQYDILANALEIKGMKEKALDIRSKMVRLNPKDGTARIKLAEMYQADGKQEDALNQYEEYARQMEDSGAPKLKLAEIYEKILAYRPDRQDMLKGLISIYHELGDQKKALRWLEFGKNMVERDPLLLKMMAGIYATQNQHETSKSKYSLLADLHLETGDLDSAIDAFTEILVIIPEDEDRLAKRVEELGPDVLPRVLEKAKKRREHIEREEAKRLAEEEAKRLKEDTEISKLKEAKEKEAKEKVQQAIKAAQMKKGGATEVSADDSKPKVASAPQPTQSKAKPLPVAPVKPVQVTQTVHKKIVTPAEHKMADASFDLAMAYLKMGLDEEAAIELEKAGLVYEVVMENGDNSVKDHLDQISNILGSRK